MLPQHEFWHNKRVLLTGHTGFKGAWLTLWLLRLGAKVTGVALAPMTQPSLFAEMDVTNQLDHHLCDIRDAAALAAIVKQSQPQIVLHLAAQALVRTSYHEPIATFATNVMGTANVLDALRGQASVRAVVAVTTDKVYKNQESTYPYREDDALGGHDPYSASKAACELVIASYRSSYLSAQGVAVASARAGNVIGGGDWSADRLLPDAIRAWGAGGELHVRRPQATRPWQHVLEPLAAYLLLAERLWHQPELASAYNFGPRTHEAASVREVIHMAQAAYGKGSTTWGQGDEGPHEASNLALEVSKASSILGIQPAWSLSNAVQRTVQWQQGFEAGTSVSNLCSADFTAYEADLGHKSKPFSPIVKVMRV